MTEPRTEQIAANLASVRQRVADACARAGRPAADVTVVAVTKTWPADDVRRLAELGIADVAENRDQEGAAKYDACADLEVSWHFVGQIQTNKARSVARWADVVHAVDRARLVHALDRAASTAGRRIGALIQVSLDESDPDPAGGGAGHRGGAALDQLEALASAVKQAEALDLRGVMAVAPLGTDPAPAFERLAAAAARLQRVDASATWISAGMSQDFEAAILHGATHVRIGSALLGNRPPLR